MQWVQRGIYVGRRVLPRMLPVRQQWWHTSRRMNLARRLMRSKQSTRRRRKVRLKVQGAASASGNAISYQMRFALSFWMIKNYATKSAGLYLIAGDQFSECQHLTEV